VDILSQKPNHQPQILDNKNIYLSIFPVNGKVTSHKDEQGGTSGYYYFWSDESGYVQVPIVRSIVEEIKN